MKMLVLSGVSIGIGVLGLILIVVFKGKVNDFYERYETLSETQKKVYKNGLVFLPFIISFILGLYYLFSELSGFTVCQYFSNTDVNIYQIGGFCAVLYGFFTIIVRFTKMKYSFFSKLHTFEDKYGYTKGNIIHMVSYSIAPILFGIFILVFGQL